MTGRGPYRVLRGNLAIAGQPGAVYTPETGRNLPAVAFGHGWLTGVSRYRGLLEHLASWGIVAAAPDTERGPVPSHLDLATDLRTTLDICSGVRLGDGTISVHPDRLALAGHGMGAGAAVIAASQRRVAAIAALYPAHTAPSAERLAADGALGDTPALILAGSDFESVGSNALPLAAAWEGKSILRTLDGATRNGLIEGRRLLSAVGTGKHESKTARTTRALLTGYLLATLNDDKTYRAFAEPDTDIPRTTLIDPHAPKDEEQPKLKVGQLAKLLRS
ncbi:alpha/beta hydrolase [Nocardia callitridis]|uniref:Alpha/beta hydrolase n=1 Tax=Nocardia callitridis TaxID=648753 RepID=A0ABP9L0P7_9NOCA